MIPLAFIIFTAIKEFSPPTLNLKKLYDETIAVEPVLIIITTGADPSRELQELACEVAGPDHFRQVINVIMILGYMLISSVYVESVAYWSIVIRFGI